MGRFIDSSISFTMSTTVHVSGIAHDTSEKEVKDFFSFCGKITTLSIKPESDAAAAVKSASVTFEKDTAAKTALLLDNTQLGKSQVHVTSASTIEDVAQKAGAAVSSSTPEDHIAQEDKPRSRIVAEYLAHGYPLSDNVIQSAISMDSKHGISSRFTSALNNFDSKYKASDKAKGVDAKYGVTERAMGAWAGLNSYFEKALNTPTSPSPSRVPTILSATVVELRVSADVLRVTAHVRIVARVVRAITSQLLFKTPTKLYASAVALMPTAPVLSVIVLAPTAPSHPQLPPPKLRRPRKRRAKPCLRAVFSSTKCSLDSRSCVVSDDGSMNYG